MSTPVRLSADELAAALDAHVGWTHDRDRNALHRRLDFADFGEALGAMVRVGVAADGMDHHPEWSNVYNRLDIWLTTHDAGGITANDLRLADAIDRIAAQAGIATSRHP